ncbi:MAG: FHA domain-containing protein, partial [Gemmataceae bacterium]|nr:FHA domain-containing protein [Gemmataceae bacterium]
MDTPTRGDLPRVALSLVGSAPPRVWQSSCHLRIGRLPELEVALDDLSVSRVHAEVYLTDDGWVVRDRGSSNGTVLNNVRIGRNPQPVRAGDLIKVGVLTFRVDDLQARPVTVKLGNKTVHVEAAARRPLGAGEFDPLDERGGAGDLRGYFRLVRAAHRMAEAARVDVALQELIDEALKFFAARRCGLFLMDEATGQLSLRCAATRPCGLAPPRSPGRTLATVAFRRRQSLLFKDRTEAAKFQSESAVSGELGTAVCAVLRAPDRELGVLHIDRETGADPFTEADLSLADTLADALALGLDRQQLVERNRALFLQTVTALSQAVEMRDEYTGNHTQRVTTYALMLAEEMSLPEDERRKLQVATQAIQGEPLTVWSWVCLAASSSWEVA